MKPISMAKSVVAVAVVAVRGVGDKGGDAAAEEDEERTPRLSRAFVTSEVAPPLAEAGGDDTIPGADKVAVAAAVDGDDVDEVTRPESARPSEAVEAVAEATSEPIRGTRLRL